MKRLVMSAVMFAGLTVGSVMAQDAAAPAAAAPAPAAAAAGLEANPAAAGEAAKPKSSGKTGFFAVVFGSGWLGVVLWAALFGCGAAAIYFIVDSSVMVRPQKIMPQSLIDKVKAGMAEGDVMKALHACETEPGPMANILSAGFSHVEEGFEVIQESIGAAADLETERIMQRLTWISVCSNLAPMLGLLGTVQGMIMCFETLATGAPDVGSLALAISQALWTTAGGLCIAIPAITFYYSIRNNANRLILRMQAMTMELIKDLRNVEVVND
ncbi:MAG TPA: MotA/TolQ/ExbB proton channel family protein [Kiritimatiellia bacterium]|nr:MotA/TolQ/ExbB proton channel family protein [Kiritimatiellia bacterium]HPS08234.1 MotA/TolQ/ExbB proton channel family protein [Kiritimatiellia bacterium]